MELNPSYSVALKGWTLKDSDPSKSCQEEEHSKRRIKKWVIDTAIEVTRNFLQIYMLPPVGYFMKNRFTTKYYWSFNFSRMINLLKIFFTSQQL